MQNSDLDLTIAEGYNTPAYQMLANDFLMELFRSGAVDIKTVLENCSFPYARKILETVKRNEQQLQQGQQGIPPEMLEKLKQEMQNGGEKGSVEIPDEHTNKTTDNMQQKPKESRVSVDY